MARKAKPKVNAAVKRAFDLYVRFRKAERRMNELDDEIRRVTYGMSEKDTELLIELEDKFNRKFWGKK
jgi:hypothetical protein